MYGGKQFEQLVVKSIACIYWRTRYWYSPNNHLTSKWPVTIIDGLRKLHSSLNARSTLVTKSWWKLTRIVIFMFMLGGDNWNIKKLIALFRSRDWKNWAHVCRHQTDKFWSWRFSMLSIETKPTLFKIVLWSIPFIVLTSLSNASIIASWSK